MTRLRLSVRSVGRSYCRINFVSDFRLPHWSLSNTAALTAKSLCCCEYSLVCVSCYLRDIYEYL